jgi:hypothetical protein
MKLIFKLLTVSLLSTGLAFAAETGKTPAKAEKPAAKKAEADKPMHLPLKGTVVAISTRTLTVKGGEGKEDRKFTINKDTEIVSGEKSAKVSDVKVGQEITGSYLRSGEGADVLTKLQISPKGSEPKKKPAAKEGDGKAKKSEAEPKKTSS